MHVPTIRIKAADPAQGEFVVINELDFDPDKHELFDAPTKAADAAPRGIKALREALTARGIEFDPNTSKADLQALLDNAPQAQQKAE